MEKHRATPPPPSLPDPPPKHCPYCGGTDLRELESWTALSQADPDNTATLEEYQCHGPCGGRSFFT